MMWDILASLFGSISEGRLKERMAAAERAVKANPTKENEATMQSLNSDYAALQEKKEMDRAMRENGL